MTTSANDTPEGDMIMPLAQEEFARLDPNSQLLVRIGEAFDLGDEETVWELRKQVVYHAEVLLAAKHTMGADWIRKRGLKTEMAEEKYGKDWLERDV